MDANLKAAVAAYVEKRDNARMTPRSAAAWTVQTFGVSVSDLANAVADTGNLAKPQPPLSERGGVSTYRQSPKDALEQR